MEPTFVFIIDWYRLYKDFEDKVAPSYKPTPSAMKGSKGVLISGVASFEEDN